MIAIRRGPLALLERIALGVASMIVSINVCTGVPLLALWLGSRAANGNVLSWTGIITAIVSLAVLAAFSVAALSRLSARYDRVTGTPPPKRQPRPWELSMRAEPAATGRTRRQTKPVEAIVVLTVVVAFIAIEVWYFFFAGSPITSGI
jgi:hypothetical protein